MGPNLLPGLETGPSDYYVVGVADRAMALLDETSSVGFRAIVELRGDVDTTALSEAWTRLAAVHPILTCVRHGGTWEPTGLPPSGEDVGQPDHHQPPVTLQVTTQSKGVRLTMYCNHVAFDGVASLILLGDLRDEYHAALGLGRSRDPDWSPRTLEALPLRTDWRTAAAAVARGASAFWKSPVSTHVDPGLEGEEPAEDHAILEIGPVLEALTPSRHKYHWSVDAVLVGIMEKAWSEVFGPPSAESTWLVARDLRPWLGVTRGMGNLSFAAGVSIPDPESALRTVIDQAEAALVSESRDLAMAGTAPRGWRPVERISFAQMLKRSKRLRAYRSVSNVGQIGDSLDRWGSASLKKVWFVGPLAHPPYNSFIAAGHGPSTLMSVRTSSDWLTAEDARALEKALLSLV